MSEKTPRIKQAIVIWTLIGLTYIGVWLIPVFMDFAAPGKGAEEAFSVLRDSSQFKWYVIPLLLVVINFYIDEIRKKNWAGVLAGFAFFLMDAFNEIWNGLYYTATDGYAAVWMCAFPTSYQPLMGWNIEIIFMFLMMGIASTKLLPEDKDEMIFGINNRHVHSFIMAWFCVIVEIILNNCGALVWNYPWWQAKFPFILFLIGYWPFFEIAYFVHDLPSTKDQVKVVSLMAAIIFVALVVFIPLGWI